MSVDVRKARSIIDPILVSLGLELVDVQFVVDQGRPVLRLLIDKEGGVTVGDCQTVTREIDTVLEVEGAVSGRYFLEVSSPGLDRPLVKEADFVKHTGKVVTLKTRESYQANAFLKPQSGVEGEASAALPMEGATRAPVIGGRRNYKGLLKGIEGGQIRVEIDRQDYQIPIGLVEKANLVY